MFQLWTVITASARGWIFVWKLKFGFSNMCFSVFWVNSSELVANQLLLFLKKVFIAMSLVRSFLWRMRKVWSLWRLPFWINLAAYVLIRPRRNMRKVYRAWNQHLHARLIDKQGMCRSKLTAGRYATFGRIIRANKRSVKRGREGRARWRAMKAAKGRKA